MPDQVVCVQNIGPRETRKRQAIGVLMMAVAIGLGAVLYFAGAARFWRVWVFLPLWLSTLGFFQARERT